jgi:hypothetical protein
LTTGKLNQNATALYILASNQIENVTQYLNISQTEYLLLPNIMTPIDGNNIISEVSLQNQILQ